MHRSDAPGAAPQAGRALLHTGHAVVAPSAPTAAWTDDLSPEVNSLDEPLRATLAKHWLEDALAEHASVGAFTRLATQLLGAAAPPELLEDAHRAALDEVRHARLCFTLASMYGAAWNGPGPLPLDALRGAPTDLATLAREALVDGCLGEGAASEFVRECARTADDPELRRVLGAVADDEARHAELGWRTLEWCLDAGGAPVAEATVAALGLLHHAQLVSEQPDGVDDATWAACGRLPPRRAMEIHARVTERVAARAWRIPALASAAPRAEASEAVRRGAPRSRKGR